MFGSFSGIAGGNISPSRFVVKTSSSGEPIITQCGTNGEIFGISQASTRKAPLTGLDDGYAAIAGETLNVIGPGDDAAQLEIAGTITAGMYLKSDTDGKGVEASADKDRVGAQAQEDGVAGDLIKVKPMRFDRSIT